MSQSQQSFYKSSGRRHKISSPLQEQSDGMKLFDTLYAVLKNWESNKAETKEVVSALARMPRIDNEFDFPDISANVFDILKDNINKEEELLLKNLLACWLKARYGASCFLPPAYFTNLSKLLNKELKDEVKACIFNLSYEYMIIRGGGFSRETPSSRCSFRQEQQEFISNIFSIKANKKNEFIVKFGSQNITVNKELSGSSQL